MLSTEEDHQDGRLPVPPTELRTLAAAAGRAETTSPTLRGQTEARTVHRDPRPGGGETSGGCPRGGVEKGGRAFRGPHPWRRPRRSSA